MLAVDLLCSFLSRALLLGASLAARRSAVACGRGDVPPVGGGGIDMSPRLVTRGELVLNLLQK